MFYINKRNSFLICFFLLGCIFLMLGKWQISRKIYKDDLIDYINQQLSHYPKNYTSKLSFQEYKKYRLKGYFIDKFYYIYGSNFLNQTSGYFVISPFILEDSSVVLVVHNWVSKASSKIFLPVQNIIDGVAIKSRKNKYAPLNNGDIYFDFNLNLIDRSLDYNREYFIVMNNDAINIDKFIKISNRHFEYILTWFTFAFFSFIIGIIYFKQNDK